MNGYDVVRTPAEVVRMPRGASEGTIACSRHHGSDWGYRNGKQLAPATSAWVSIGKPVDENYKPGQNFWGGGAYGGVVFTCKAHTGNVKAQQSKGSHGWGRDRVRLIETATIEAVAADPQKFLAVVLADIEREKQEQADSRLARIRRHWDQMRAEHLKRGLESYQKVNHTAADEYGCSFVSFDVRSKLTPKAARELAALLLAEADKAEAFTRQQVKP